jgi:hypothetical protein
VWYAVPNFKISLILAKTFRSCWFTSYPTLIFMELSFSYPYILMGWQWHQSTIITSYCVCNLFRFCSFSNPYDKRLPHQHMFWEQDLQDCDLLLSGVWFCYFCAGLLAQWLITTIWILHVCTQSQLYMEYFSFRNPYPWDSWQWNSSMIA